MVSILFSTDPSPKLKLRHTTSSHHGNASQRTPRTLDTPIQHSVTALVRILDGQPSLRVHVRVSYTQATISSRNSTTTAARPANRQRKSHHHLSSSSSTGANTTAPTTAAAPSSSLSLPSSSRQNSAAQPKQAAAPSSSAAPASASTSKSHPPSPSPLPPPAPVPTETAVLAPISNAPSGSEFDIHSYPSTDLLRLLASLLTQFAATNDALPTSTASSSTSSPSAEAPPLDGPNVPRPPIWQTLTTASHKSFASPSSTLSFHARNFPTISLESYLLRILKYFPTTNEVFLALLVYFDRMSALCEKATGRAFVIGSYNVHRLVIAGVTVASKFFSDVFYTNSRYAKPSSGPAASTTAMRAMGAFDAYGGSIASDPPPPSAYASAPAPAGSKTPSASFAQPPITHSASSTSSTSSTSAHDQDDQSDAETEIETETEGGDTTDDEPTIRPAGSRASSSCSSSSVALSGDEHDDDEDMERRGRDEDKGYVHFAFIRRSVLMIPYSQAVPSPSRRCLRRASSPVRRDAPPPRSSPT
ncbi:hypothetical protein PLICRDRAFT_610647 [Plicaturopsis crispa FD-325 SS-3]|nr:hypothetical protein PLICRDRAFT_610647 [Plicaturopsis crispa FD-325 SS-3]